MDGFTPKEHALFRTLSTPAKVQDFLNRIPINFEIDGVDRIKSPLRVLREGSAHCIEGALLGAYILSLHGYLPRILHLKAVSSDSDHVIALFRVEGRWGALSKTNHATLRYREAVYASVRELVMSYFHEYTTDAGNKTLRAYSAPLDLRVFEAGWETEEADLWGIDEALDRARHYTLLSLRAVRRLRLAEPIERKAGALLEWPRTKRNRV